MRARCHGDHEPRGTIGIQRSAAAETDRCVWDRARGPAGVNAIVWQDRAWLALTFCLRLTVRGGLKARWSWPDVRCMYDGSGSTADFFSATSCNGF